MTWGETELTKSDISLNWRRCTSCGTPHGDVINLIRQLAKLFLVQFSSPKRYLEYVNVSHECLANSWKAHVTNKATTRRLFAHKTNGVVKACVSGQASRGERAHSPLLTSTLSAFLRMENNALAGQSPAFKDSQRFNAAAVKTSEQKTSGAPHLCGCCGPHTLLACLPACRPTDRPPIGPFKSEVHPKLQRLAPPRDGDEVTASLRSTLAMPTRGLVLSD